MPFDYLTANESAERAGVSRRTITRWIESGRLTPATKLPGDTGAMLFDPSDVDAAANRVPSPAGSDVEGQQS